MATGNNIGPSVTPPARPPLPDAEKLARSRERLQSVKASLGNTTRKVTKATSGQTQNLSVKSVKPQTKSQALFVQIKKRTIEKLHQTRSRILEKYDNTKKKAAHYNEARKTWQQSPVINTLEVGKMTVSHARAKAKKHAGTARQKLTGAQENIKELYGRGKSGINTWKQSKKEVTLAVAAELFEKTKNKAQVKSKAIRDYTIRKAKQAGVRATSLIAKLKTTTKNILVEKTLHSRQCEVLDSNKKV